MKTIPMRRCAAVVALWALVGLAGCAPVPESSDGDRMRALETEVESLRQEMRARDEALRGELAVIRRNIDGVRDALAALGAEGATPVPPSSAAPPSSAEPGPAEAERDALDDELDVKAKTFVSESMDRLLEITKKLLDRMDQELEKRDEPPADGGQTPEAGQGERI